MATETPPPELKTYHGNCHCGAFKFILEVPEITSVTVCNCSICFKKGYKWVFPGDIGKFTVERGEGTLKDYEFGPVTMSHRFCPKCGTGVMGKRHGVPNGGVGVNVRTLLDVDTISLPINVYDGKTTRGPQYEPPKFAGELPKPVPEIPNPKLYTGSCHCGAVTLALLSNGPLSDKPDPVGYQECDCSICVRNGTYLLYPERSQIAIHGIESMTSYTFGRKFVSHDFCSTCGVAVRLHKLDIGEARWHEEHPGVDYARHTKQSPVNLRLFERVEWDDLKIPRGTWSQRGPKYVCPDPE